MKKQNEGGRSMYCLRWSMTCLKGLITDLKMKSMSTSKASWCDRKCDSINVHCTNKWKVRWSNFTRTLRACSIPRDARRVHSSARSNVSDRPITSTDVSRWRSGRRTAGGGTAGGGPSERSDPRRAFGSTTIRLVIILCKTTFTAPPPDLEFAYRIVWLHTQTHRISLVYTQTFQQILIRKTLDSNFLKLNALH